MLNRDILITWGPVRFILGTYLIQITVLANSIYWFEPEIDRFTARFALHQLTNVELNLRAIRDWTLPVINRFLQQDFTQQNLPFVSDLGLFPRGLWVHLHILHTSLGDIITFISNNYN